MDGVPDAVCQTRIGFIHILNADQIALIINAEVDNPTVCIGKRDDFLVNVIDQLIFILNALAFKLHIEHLHHCLILLYSHFHVFQSLKVKIHFIHI